MEFEDLFSTQSAAYVKYRPTYPIMLFEYLAGLVDSHETAWDCGTGNGQAALSLVEYFERVVATDASPAQIKNAIPHPKITYAVASAEHSTLPPLSIDLISVAQALHWFDLDRFYAEAQRVLKPRGVIAVYGYHFSQIKDTIDQLILTYAKETLEGCWGMNIERLWNNYQDIPFPFEPVATPSFGIETAWDMIELFGFLRSWSATQTYLDRFNRSPLEPLWAAMQPLWGDPDRKRKVRWTLVVKVGRQIGERGIPANI